VLLLLLLWRCHLCSLFRTTNCCCRCCCCSRRGLYVLIAERRLGRLLLPALVSCLASASACWPAFLAGRLLLLLLLL
jgi:hypothetical protein